MQDRALRYFLAVIRSGSMRGAAEALHVAPSAISRQIAELEAAHGLPLLERQPRGVVPTEAGRVLAAHAQRREEEALLLRDQMRRLRGGEGGVVRLCCGPGFLADLLDNGLAGFAAAHPGIGFQVSLGGTDRIQDAVAEGEADLGLAYNPPARAGLESLAVASQPLAAILSPDHPLAAQVEPLPLRRLAGEPLGLLPAGHGIRHLLARAEADGGFRMVPRLETASIELLRRFVMAAWASPSCRVSASWPSLARARWLPCRWPIRSSRAPARICWPGPAGACRSRRAGWVTGSRRGCWPTARLLRFPERPVQETPLAATLGVTEASPRRQEVAMDIRKVGVVGLGNMGLGMAASLIRAGFTVLGHDLSAARREAAVAAGVRCEALPDLLRGADALVFSLPYARDVEAVATTPGALLERRDRKVVVIDTSTSDPGTTRRLAATLAEAGHGLLDAPVSGGPSGAAAGSLTMMIGGAAEDLALVRPVTDAMAAHAVHVGPSGAGNIAKLVNNLLVAAHLITTGEAMRLSEAAGLSAADALKVVNAATGRSAISEVMYPRWVLPGTFDSGFSAGLMRKDVRLAAELAAETGQDLPLSALVDRIWRETRGSIPDSADFTRMADFRTAPTRTVRETKDA